MPVKEIDYQCKSDLRQEIHLALCDEYEVAKKRSRAKPIKLYNGIRLQTLAGTTIYRFEYPKDIDYQIEIDSPYELRIEGNYTNGSIFSITEYFIDVQFDEDYGDSISQLEIVVDLSILIDLVDRTIVNIDKHSSKYEETTINQLFNPTLISHDYNLLLNHNQRKDRISLTENQVKAIQESASRVCSIIWGPPGTGKTKTLQGLIAEFLTSGKRVLFASNTNNAIDSLLQGIAESDIYNVFSDMKESSKILRLGTQSNELVKEHFSLEGIIQIKFGKLLDEMRQLKSSADKLEEEIHNNTSQSELSKDQTNINNLFITEKRRLLSKIKTDILSIKQRIKSEQDKLLLSANLVCCTLIKASYDKALRAERFDVMVVDEVSMASVPQLYCTAALIKTNVVLCGDHLQLQPICQSESTETIKWLGTGIFSVLEGINQFRLNGYKFSILEPITSKLNVQRRMPESVSNLIKSWYDIANNELIDDYDGSQHSTNNITSDHFLCSPENIYLLDTSKLNTYHRRFEKSPYNFIHAVIAAEFLRELIEDYNISDKNILYISPYKAQCNLTKAFFEKQKSTNDKPRAGLISSVHKTQGSEAELVIFDLTDGKQSKPTFFNKTSEFFIHNVAISRTKHKIVFLLDFEKMKKVAKTEPNAAISLIINQISESTLVDATRYRDKVLINPESLEEFKINEHSALIPNQMLDESFVLNELVYYNFFKFRYSTGSKKYINSFTIYYSEEMGKTQTIYFKG